MESGKREKVAYLAALVQRGELTCEELTCEEALAVSDETSSSSRSTVVSAGWWSLLTKNTCLNY